VELEHFSIQSNANQGSNTQVAGDSEDKEEAAVVSRGRLRLFILLAITLFSAVRGRRVADPSARRQSAGLGILRVSDPLPFKPS
jgi:hypothetical protein